MTARVALIGSPLRRRHSEVMHNAAFRHFGIDARYELRRLEVDELDAFFAEARGEAWLGFQVTTPHKEKSLALVDEVEPESMSIGAINSGLRASNGRLIGFNTDSPGFATAVFQGLGLELKGSRVAVAGSGGAARAVVHACLTRGAERVQVGNRTADRAVRLAAEMDDRRLSGGGFDEAFEAALGEADLAVNTTTVGMTSAGQVFDVGLLRSHASVIDLIYVPEATDLVAAARERGLRAVNGLGMLVAQAAIAFERWTGVVGADAVMRRAVDAMDPG
jgi:shikimate dehydrogenase